MKFRFISLFSYIPKRFICHNFQGKTYLMKSFLFSFCCWCFCNEVSMFPCQIRMRLTWRHENWGSFLIFFCHDTKDSFSSLSLCAETHTKKQGKFHFYHCKMKHTKLATEKEEENEEKFLDFIQFSVSVCLCVCVWKSGSL